MKVVFRCPEAKIETKTSLLAVLPWLYNTAAVDHRLGVLGLRRHGRWKKVYREVEAPVTVKK